MEASSTCHDCEPRSQPPGGRTVGETESFQLGRREAKNASLIGKSEVYLQQRGDANTQSNVSGTRDTTNNKLDFSRTFQQPEIAKDRITCPSFCVCSNKDRWSHVGML